MKNGVRPMIAGVAGIAVLALIAAGCGGSAQPDAATVGDTAIERSDFEDELRILVDNIAFRTNVLGLAEASPVVPSNISATWLQQRILQVVIDDELAERGLMPTEADLETARAELEAALGTETFLGFPESYQDTLVARGARFTLLAAELAPPLPTEAIIREYFDANYERYLAECPRDQAVAHILVETEAEADEVVAQLADGADFTTVAVTTSTDPSAATNGGALGCLAEGLFVPEFEAAALAATPGEPTAPVQTDFGFHVILVTEPFVTFASFGQRAANDYSAEVGDPLLDFLRESLEVIEVTVDPRYGTWVIDDEGIRVAPPEAPDVRDGSDDPLGDLTPLG